MTGAVLHDGNHGAIPIRSIAPASVGGDGALVFVDSRKHAGLFEGLRAAAVFCPADLAEKVPAGIAVLTTTRPQVAFATVARALYPSAVRPDPLTGEAGVSPSAFVSVDASIEPGAIIEPGAVVGPGAAIGAGTVVAPGAVVAAGCQVGRGGYIGPNASIQNAMIGNRVIIHGGVRIGQDGFGYVPGRGGLEKMPQIGRVIIQDDVEIGANTTIDRGAMDDTVIGEGTKVDNLVQIAHNVKIGRMCIIAGQCGISGSATIGDYVMLGGNVGVKDHVSIGQGGQYAARSGIMRDMPAGGQWGGAPAMPIREHLRQVAAIQTLARKERD